VTHRHRCTCNACFSTARGAGRPRHCGAANVPKSRPEAPPWNPAKAQPPCICAWSKGSRSPTIQAGLSNPLTQPAVYTSFPAGHVNPAATLKVRDAALNLEADPNRWSLDPRTRPIAGRFANSASATGASHRESEVGAREAASPTTSRCPHAHAVMVRRPGTPMGSFAGIDFRGRPLPAVLLGSYTEG